MSNKVLYAHVPVDMVDIVYGPGTCKCFDLRKELARLQENPGETPDYVDLRLTLRTLASTRPFKKTLHLTKVFKSVFDEEFHFTAIFSGRIVSGIYNTRTRTGWFNLD